MKNHNESVNKKIKLYLYLVICFVLSVLAQEISISNDLDIIFLNIFFITLLIIIFYLLDRYSNQGALLNTKKEHKDIMCLGINDIIENYVLEKTINDFEKKYLKGMRIEDYFCGTCASQ